MSDPRALRIAAWKPVQTTSTFRGAASVTFPSSFCLHGISVYSGGGKAWIKLPRAPVVIRGCDIKQAGGKPVFEPVCAFHDRRAFEAFEANVLAALQRDFPDAIGESL
jgi:DNA-binding cell septation regulator SpoVG